jgi:adenylate cyclase
LKKITQQLNPSDAFPGAKSHPTMKSSIKKILRGYRAPLIFGLATASCIFGLRLLGVFQPWEFDLYDRLLQLRPAEPIDNRFVIVGVGEEDLKKIGNALISDQVLAQLVNRIKAQNPRVIGMDFYRSLPVGDGLKELEQVFRVTPNLIGIQKVVADQQGAAVAPNPVLAAANQVAASDVVVDRDGRVRRGILYLFPSQNQVIETIALRVALDYLAAVGITPDPTAAVMRLRGVSFHPFNSHDGGYVGADDGGYQIILNPRGQIGSFQQVSASDVLEGRVAPNLMQDKIVLIGNTSADNADVFFSSYSSASNSSLEPISGVEIHATLSSQILSAVLDGRPLMRAMPLWTEFALMAVFACASAVISLQNLTRTYKTAFTLLLPVSMLVAAYLSILFGWWLPVAPAIASTLVAPGALAAYESWRLKRLSDRDELTQLANRRAFNEALEREWSRCWRSHTALSIILCDVDYFKLYNDTYGHLKGDECLRQVAKALKKTAARPTDLVARYGGEEFVILLSNTDCHGALKVAESIRVAVMSLQLPHSGSKVSEFVTLSLGASTVIPSGSLLPESLVNTADLGLYEAKSKGRNQSVLRLF